MNYSGIINCSIVDGDGFRVSLFVSGCKHCCEGCHNRQTWDFKFGKPYTNEVEDILFDRIDKPFIKGLTLTGGDPMYSADEVSGIVDRFRERFGDTKDIWLYTGFTMDEIQADGKMKSLVDKCDFVVDGIFKKNEKDTTIAFRGSRNQIIWEKDPNGVFVQSKYN